MYAELLDIIVAGSAELDDCLEALGESIDNRDAETAWALVHKCRFWIRGLRDTVKKVQGRNIPAPAEPSNHH